MPAPTYINVEYFFYKTFIFFKEVYLFFANVDWFDVVFWAKVISFVISCLFIAGIVYNVRGIIRAAKKKEEL